MNHDMIGTAIGQGLAIALFAGLFALQMARHTSGYPGFNLVGYILYTVAMRKCDTT